MTYVTREGERLYLNSWEYNTCRILTELAKLITVQGGRVQPQKSAFISIRGCDEHTTPISVTHTSYICFVLDEIYYYYSVKSNTFYDTQYIKTPVKNEGYSANAMLSSDAKEWFKDCHVKIHCSQEDIEIAAQQIFSRLKYAPMSEIFKEYIKIKVPNTYNDDYHKEEILREETFRKIGF